AAAMAPERGERSLPAGTEGLPRVFLQSLRTLFDILDDRRRGYVHLREIESRWRGAEARELPAGVMEGLRRAAPASGYLTFERFRLGPGDPPGLSRGAVSQWDSDSVPSSPLTSISEWAEVFLKKSLLRVSFQLLRSPHQPGGAGAARWVPATVSGEPTASAGCEDAAGGLMLSSVTGGDAKAAGQSQGDGGHPGAGDTRRHQRGRAEHRRHTITNGVDFSMLKHMKELEQEKDFLLQGLELIERAREWYHQHIQFMQERQRLLGKNKTSAEFLPEGSQSHLGRLVPKLQEVNRCLGDLLSTAGKPANPSSALSRLVPVASPASAGSQQAINMLKEQNRLLTKEVTDKSERITQLEQEKSALIKQLFEARARNNHETSQLDSTFI
ncbi:SAPC2 protein, partial [Fregetta grallaria]|nr:SAPC2 protein [Fregetta grallaria]